MALYRMLAGLVVMTLFVVLASTMFAVDFPGTTANGPDATAIPRALEPVVVWNPPAAQCNDFFTGIACAVGALGSSLINVVSIPFKMLGAVIGLLTGVANFYVPDFASNPILFALLVLLISPIVIVMSLVVFNIVKSVIPTVGGSADG